MQPEQLGPFRIGRVIGRGGMGAVYEGVHEKTGEMAAVKALLSTLEDDNELRLRFEAEIDTLKRLRHPNIVRLFGFGEEQGMLYYVMEMVDGPSLHQEIKRQRLFQWHEVAKIGLEMCLALKHGHDRGITHRDIKPANILLDQQGTLKLSDYGIAHFFGGQRLTEVNSVVGTLEYMSPEQSLANPVGPRSDLYSLGAVLYVLLVGKPPFSAKNLAEIVRKHQRNIVESIRAIRLDVPDELETIILDLLKIRPEERPGNAYLVAKRFQSLMQALVGPPERILVKPMTSDSPTHLPLEPARIPYRGDEEVKEPIGRPRGMVVENGIIDLGGIVDDGMTNPIPPAEIHETESPVTKTEPGPERSDSFEEPDRKTADPDASDASLADSFGRPGSELDDRRTMGMSIVSAEPTLQEIRPTTSPMDESSGPNEVTEMSPTQKTKVMTKKQNVSEEPNSDATVRSLKNLQGTDIREEIRHGEIYLEDRPEYRRSKDEPIPNFDTFEILRPESSPDELTKTEDEEVPPKHDLLGAPASVVEDEPTIDGFGTNHQPFPAGVHREGNRSSSMPGSLMEPYALQGPAAATTAGARNSENTLPERSASHFVSVVDQDFDDFDDTERQRRPIVSLQTVLASCCLILIGLLVFYLLQPVPPDIQYARIVNSIDTGSDEDAFIKSLRRAEKDIRVFLGEHSGYPKADQLLFYQEQLELDKLERDIERNLQAMGSKMAIPASQRAYIEAMASAKTDPERTIVKLKALIDLFQSDSKPVNESEPDSNAATDSSGDVSETPKPTRSRFSRGTRDEDFVFLANRQLERLERDIDQINADQIDKLRLKLQHAKDLESTNPERSDAIRAAIVELYQNKTWAEEIVQEARKGLEH